MQQVGADGAVSAEEINRGDWVRREIMGGDKKMEMAWFGFWIFLAIFMVCDHWIFSRGYDSFFQRHKTVAEKELQQLAIELQKLTIEEKQLKIELLRRGNSYE